MKATVVYSVEHGRWVIVYSEGGSDETFRTTGQLARWMGTLGPAQASGEKIVAGLQLVNPGYVLEFKLPA